MMAFSSKTEKNDSCKRTDQGHLLLKLIKTEKVEPIDEVEATFVNELEHPCVKEEDEFLNISDVIEKKNDVPEEPPFNCNLCGRSFLLRCRFNTHLLYHSGERPFKCDKCDKAYVMKRDLNRHTARIHSAYFREREVVKTSCFTCGVCGEAFPLGSQLRVHERTHSDETPYQCEHCKLVFRQSYALMRHVCRVTEEKKPFIGNVSDADVSRGGTVFTHNSTSYSGNPFECEVCGKRFLQRSTLQEHARTHRNDHLPAFAVTANHSTDGE